MENAYGINNLGYCYGNGIGTSIDKQKAFELYQEAANLGNTSGINNLGDCYYSGIGIGMDEQKAFELYQKAANLGLIAAQNNLDFMDEIKDANQVIYWYKILMRKTNKKLKKLKILLNENVFLV